MNEPASAAVTARSPQGRSEPRRARPETPPRRHLRVVEPRRRPGAAGRGVHPSRLVAVGGAALVVIVMFALVYLHVILAQRQFQLDHLSSEIQASQVRYQNLRLQVAQLSAPDNIVSTAESQLGMQPPASVTYLHAAAGAPTTTPSSATPGGDAQWTKVKAAMAGAP